MAAKSNVDWEAVYADYHAGTMSLNAIAQKHQTSKAGIIGYASRHAWVRLPKPAYQALVTAKAALPESSVQKPPPTPSAAKAVSPMEGVLELAAEQGAAVVRDHRDWFKNFKHVAKMLCEQLTDSTSDFGMIEERIVEYFSTKAEMSPAQAGVYRQQMSLALGAVSLGSRSKTLLQLVQALERIVDMERKSFKLDETDEERKYEDSIKELQERAIALKAERAHQVN